VGKLREREDLLEEKGPSGQYTVLFDGSCPVCRGAVARLKGWDREGKLSYLPAKSPEAEARFPWISREAVQNSIHLIGPNQESWEGAGAVEELVRVLPGWRWIAWVFRLPMARPVARRVYRWIARNRYQSGCGL